MYDRIKNNRCNEIIDIQIPCHGHDTRWNEKLIPVMAKKNVYFLNINASGPRFWNKLPTSIKNSHNIKCFKKKLKNHLLFNSLYN